MTSNLDLQAGTLGKIEEMAQSALAVNRKVALIDLPKEPPGVYGLITEKGYERVVANPPPRVHSLHSVDQIPGAVERYTKAGFEPSVWYSSDEVVIVLDDNIATRMDDRALCSFETTKEYDWLREFADQGKTVNQKAFLILVRTVFADALGEQQLDSLVRSIRNVTFTNGQVTRGEVQRGRESMGRDVMAEVRGNAGDIPEEVNLDVRIFNDQALKGRFRIRCAIEIDVTVGQFSMIPLGSGLDGILDEQMAGLRELLGGLSCPVFYGSP